MNILKPAKTIIEIGVIVLLVMLFVPALSPLIMPLKEPAMRTAETVGRPEYRMQRYVVGRLIARAIFRR